MNVAFLGATRGMGRALARKMAERGDRLVLLGRRLDELERSARDLEVRGARGEVEVGECDLERPETFEPALDEAVQILGALDAVVVTAGAFATQAELEADTQKARHLATINFANTLAFCEAARVRLLAGGGGTLCVFSSVAGDRGRKPVIIYGASKAGLSHYLEGLDHKYRGEGLRVVTVKPGFIKTGMTADLEPPPFAGDPDEVADVVVRAIDRGQPVVYAPPIWRWVMCVIRRLPRAVMRRVQF